MVTLSYLAAQTLATQFNDGQSVKIESSTYRLNVNDATFWNDLCARIQVKVEMTLASLADDYDHILNIPDLGSKNALPPAKGFSIGKSSKMYWYISPKPDSGKYRCYEQNEIGQLLGSRYVYPETKIIIHYPFLREGGFPLNLNTVDMSENEHSNHLFYPGPYRVVEGEYLEDYAIPIRDKDDKVLARLAAGIGNRQVRFGTARLLAAAPTMYEAIYKTMIALQASGLWNTEEPFMEAMERAMGEVLGADVVEGDTTE